MKYHLHEHTKTSRAPRRLAALALLPAALLLHPPTALAQGTAFTYQGQLAANGAPANGVYDFTFTLSNTNAPGVGQLGTVTNLDVGVTNGLFTTTLDFGAAFGAAPTWLAIGVRTNGGAAFAALSPLQELTPVPYALTAASAATVGGASGASADTAGTLVLRDAAGNFSAGTITLNNNSAVMVNGQLGLYLGGQANSYQGGAGNTYLSTNTPPNGYNTASGVGALAANTEGNANAAVGQFALGANTIGSYNAAFGEAALGHNTTGYQNTASGQSALGGNTTGYWNTADGQGALASNTSGHGNTASGTSSLVLNTSGANNAAVGLNSLFNNTNGNNNTAVGYQALGSIPQGSGNLALGSLAGSAYTNNESNNIDLGNAGVAGDSGIIRIGTPGTHTDTYLAGVIHGDGSGLANIPSSALIVPNGAITGNLLAPGSVGTAQLATNIGVWTQSGNNVSYSQGNVGIGTTTPETSLTVTRNAAGAAGPTVRLENNAGAAYDKARLEFTDVNLPRAALEWTIINNNGAATWNFLNTFTASTATGTNSLLFLDPRTGVGIGTTTPQQALDVNGNINASGSIFAGNVGIGTTTPQAPLQVTGPVRMGSETTSEAPNKSGLVVRRINSTSDAAGQIIAYSGGHAMRLQRDGTPGGLLLRIVGYPGGGPTCAGTGITGTGQTVNVCIFGYNGGNGTYQVFTDSQAICYFRLSFGDPAIAGDMTEVVMSRFADGGGNNDINMVGTLTSTVNQ